MSGKQIIKTCERGTLFCIASLLLHACVKPYNPPPSSQNLKHLVVEGTIVIGSPTKIKLSRSTNIGDSINTVQERNAQVSIQSESGNSYFLQSTNDGVYTIENGPVSFTDKYSLKIHTVDGSDYVSDFVEAKPSPPIDSLEWKENDDIFIYVNTHDPSNTTKYYRWEFEETSQYNAFIESFLDFRNGQLVYIDSSELRFSCYKFFNSKEILIGTTTALSEDLVKHSLITRVRNNYSKIAVRYSILVKQYALTPESYKFWQLLKFNSEHTGNIFDPQAAQLNSNIHSVTRPDEVVIGYITASSMTEKRIFIKQNELIVRTQSVYEKLCKVLLISPESAPAFLNTGDYLPGYYVSGGGLAIAPPVCIDCRLQGGITAKPSYW